MNENEKLRFSDETADAMRSSRLLDNIRAVQGDILAKEFNADIEEMADAMMRRRQQRQEIEAKAAAMDRALASWGMTWEQYQGAQQPPAATLLGRPMVVAKDFPDVGGIVGVAFTKELAADVAREMQTGTDAPAHGREPNVDSEETRVEAGGTGQAREPRTETEAR